MTLNVDGQAPLHARAPASACWRAALLTATLLTSALTCAAEATTLASPIAGDAEPAPPWRVTLLPRQKRPVTRFDVVTLDGARVLRLRADRSYGTLVQAFDPARSAASHLRWAWRVDEAPAADLRTREGDDVAIKVCALYDWPRSRLSIGERAKLATASALTGETLPTATVCYVWDAGLRRETLLANAYTARVRMIAAGGGELGRWHDVDRDLGADFRRAFADEWREGDALPPLLAIVVGADTDNTLGKGLAYLRAIELSR